MHPGKQQINLPDTGNVHEFEKIWKCPRKKYCL